MPCDSKPCPRHAPTCRELATSRKPFIALEVCVWGRKVVGNGGGVEHEGAAAGYARAWGLQGDMAAV